MPIRYLQDVSSLLALVSAARELNRECHLQTEIEMLKYYFVFDHITYVRYVSFQTVYLKSIKALQYHI